VTASDSSPASAPQAAPAPRDAVQAILPPGCPNRCDERSGSRRTCAWRGGGKIASFFRFPVLHHPPRLMPYLSERNIAVFSTDIDSRDFKLLKPEDVIKIGESQLEKHGKSIMLMRDFKHHTAEALPELIRQFREGG